MSTEDYIRRIEKTIRWEADQRKALQKIAYILRRYVQETGECLDFILDPTPGTDEEAEKIQGGLKEKDKEDLDAELRSWLWTRAKRLKVSRPKLIRMCIQHYLDHCLEEENNRVLLKEIGEMQVLAQNKGEAQG